MPNYKLQHISLLYVKTELKNHICNRFYGISCEGPILMEQVLKNADISILKNFLAIKKKKSRYREILPSTIYMPNFRLIGPFKQKLQMGSRICPPPAIPICKKPRLFRVNSLPWNSGTLEFLGTNHLIFTGGGDQKMTKKLFAGGKSWKKIVCK